MSGSRNDPSAHNVMLCHIAAMPDLNGSGSSFFMNAVRQVLQLRNNFFAQPQLVRKRKSASFNSRISDCGHADTSGCNGLVITNKFIAYIVLGSHTFEGC